MLQNRNTPVVLVIDDNDVDRSVASKVLNSFICTILFSDNGRDGFISIKENKPNIVLLDIFMPHFNGFEVREKMQNHPDLRNIPIVYLSVLDDYDTKERIASLKNCILISKPYDPHLLRDVLVDKGLVLKK